MLAASSHVQPPSRIITAAITGIGAAVRARQAGCSANCDATGASTTIGSSRAKISRFLTCDSAMCSRPSTSAIRGGVSLTPL